MERIAIISDIHGNITALNEAIKDIKYAFEELEFAEHKYDYDKLPKQN